jgi:hypothetical protein
MTEGISEYLEEPIQTVVCCNEQTKIGTLGRSGYHKRPDRATGESGKEHRVGAVYSLSNAGVS